MGYEVLYKFYDRDKEGNYNKEETKDMKRKVGEPFEDVTLEKLASVIMSQLARRDIWIYDVEIHELKKAKITFKETKGGIVIKNKKFLVDGANIICQEIPEAPANQLVVAGAAPPQVNLAPTTANKRPIKFVVLDPDEPNLAKIRGSGLAFVPNKRYPVFSEMVHPKQFGVMVYTMWDENKREVNVMDHYFVNADQMLKNGFVSSVDGKDAPRLSHNDYETMDVPDIRR